MRIRFGGFWRSAVALAGATFSPFVVHADAVPAPPPEIQRTVAAFTGHWILTGTDVEPGAKSPAPVKADIDCKPAALGAAVNCLITATVAGDAIEAAAVIGYSPDEHIVRWMEISSTGEYHDHRGRWILNDLRFEPLTYTVAGSRMTEHFTVSFLSANRVTWKVAMETGSGQSHLEVSGTRTH